MPSLIEDSKFFNISVFQIYFNIVIDVDIKITIFYSF